MFILSLIVEGVSGISMSKFLNIISHQTHVLHEQLRGDQVMVMMGQR